MSQLNKSSQAKSQGLEFSIDKDSNRTVVKVIDQTTKEVLRQIPTRRRWKSPSRSIRPRPADQADRLRRPRSARRCFAPPWHPCPWDRPDPVGPRPADRSTPRLPRVGPALPVF